MLHRQPPLSPLRRHRTRLHISLPLRLMPCHPCPPQLQPVPSLGDPLHPGGCRTPPRRRMHWLAVQLLVDVLPPHRPNLVRIDRQAVLRGRRRPRNRCRAAVYPCALPRHPADHTPPSRRRRHHPQLLPPPPPLLRVAWAVEVTVPLHPA